MAAGRERELLTAIADELIQIRRAVRILAGH